jgi:hypothetical protein
MLKLAYQHDRRARMPVLRKLRRERAASRLLRGSEVLALEQRQLNLEAGTLSLDPGQTKNGEGRMVILTSDLKLLLTAPVRALYRPATAGFPESMGDGPQKIGECRNAAPRSRADGGQKHGAGRCSALGGDETDRPPDRERLPPIRDRVAGRP